MNSKRSSILFAFVCVCGFAGAASLSTSVLGYGQEAKENLNISVTIADGHYEALHTKPIMVSAIKDGEVTNQQEVMTNSSVRFALPPGLYDVRVEGDGMLTVVKRGILVKANEQTQIIGGPMRPGTGVKIVEYATTGLSREELASRLAKLEAAVAELQKARPR